MSTLATNANEARRSATPSTFDLWAEVYDTQVNPFLSLEERIMQTLLPDVRGLNVLDAGCGTGRMLGLLKARNAEYVIGVDSSSAMLERARSAHDVDVRYGSCTALPVDDASIDCVISSFVLSYISDLEAFAEEVGRVTRSAATVLLSDVHPTTARELNWRRSFRWSGQEIEIASEGWQVDQIRDAFTSRGFRVAACIEPGFSSPEQALFARAHKVSSFVGMQGLPAIYVLELTRETTAVEFSFSFTGARCALTAVDSAFADLATCGEKVEQIDGDARVHAASAFTLDLSGYLLLPGLINAHDHLEFGLFPRLGHGPYGSAADWAEDIHLRDATAIALHRNVPRTARIAWGAIRNLLAGVTTVCHHNPLTPEMLDADFPVTVLQDFAWAHSLALEDDLRAKFESASDDQPFVIHAAEGVDARSFAELEELVELGTISSRTVLVHGLAISPDAVATLNERGVSVVTCPSSNEFLFDRIPSFELLAGLERLALGSDSPLTAAGDLLDELRFSYRRTGLREDELYRMVTLAPSQILRLKNGEGRLAPGAVANFIATKDCGKTPAATLTQMSARDVELVVRGGRAFLASEDLYQRLPEKARVGLELLIVDGRARWIRAPLARLFSEAACVMDGDTLSLAGKKVSRGHSA